MPDPIIDEVLREIEEGADVDQRHKTFARAVRALLEDHENTKKIKPAIKPGWSIPCVLCPRCAATLLPSAILDIDEWSFGWDCPRVISCGESFMAGEEGTPQIDWPFTGNYARPQDMRDVGFVVV